MRVAGSVRRLSGLADATVSPDQVAAETAGATVYSGNEGFTITAPGTDPNAPTNFFNVTDPGAQGAAVSAMASLPVAGLKALIPTLPWWVWVGGAFALYVVVRKALK